MDFTTADGPVSSVFAALGDRTRLTIVGRLSADGPLATMKLAHGTTFTRQGITKHLRALQRAGLVRADRVGRDCVWELRPERLAILRAYLDEISAQWDDALARLRTMVEE
jgi:DNA-binding transcriptional ArsR family regulator